MKLTLENTTKVITLDGAECRIWEGKSEGGVPCHVFVQRVAVHEDDHSEFEHDLRAEREPSAEVAQYPDELTTPPLCSCCPSHFDVCSRCSVDPRRNLLIACFRLRERHLHPALLHDGGHGPTTDTAALQALGALLHTWRGKQLSPEAVDLGTVRILLASAIGLLRLHGHDHEVDALREQNGIVGFLLDARMYAADEVKA